MTALTLPTGSWWSWAIRSFDGANLMLVAGPDLTYHHELELVFTDVAYIEAPATFEHAAFREPTLMEQDKVRRYVGEPVRVLVAFDVEANYGDGMLPCLIAADDYTLTTGPSVPR